METKLAYNEVRTMEIRELIRRYQSGQSISQISKATGRDRKTIRKYFNLLETTGVKISKVDVNSESLNKALIKITDQIKRTPEKQNLFNLYQEEIKELIEDKSSPLKLKSAFKVVCARHNLEEKSSYSSFKRFVRSNRLITKPKTTCRIETPPGLQVQVDYAKVGLLRDRQSCKRRTIYAFIGTLSMSRHKFVEFVYKQDQRSFAESHVKMFNFFGGVPKTIVIDNLKSGVIKPDLYDPKLNRSYAEVSEHYNFFIDTARVASPKDKPKVERDVQTIREEFRTMLALEPNLSINQANKKILKFLKEDYGRRKHGTTQEEPIRVFEEIEKRALLELPADDFEVCQWKQAKVHPDCYIQINKKSYSVPYIFVGKRLLVKIKTKIIEIYYNETFIKMHIIPKGKRQTDYSDFPENIQNAVNKDLPKYLQNKAEELGGEKLREVIRKLLTPHAFINLRRAQGIISIAKQFPKNLNEKAASEALLRRRSPHPKDYKKLIESIKIKEETVSEGIAVSEETETFTRDIEYFVYN